MGAARLDEHLPCKAAKAEHIGLQKARAVRQGLCQCALCCIGHMLRHEEDALSAEWLARQRLRHRRKAGVRLARSCASDDEFKSCRHTASAPPCVKRAMLPFAVRVTSR